MKTLVIVSHPYPDNSHTIAALQQVAEQMPDVTVRNLETLYGNRVDGFDLAAEQAAQEAADRVVYLFPIHWFNLSPMLKAYQNEVWTYGWAFGPEGKALYGKEMQVVVSAGASAHTYSAEGLIHCAMDEVLSPMKASAYYVGMRYNTPLAFHEAMNPAGDRLDLFRTAFAACLKTPLASA